MTAISLPRSLFWAVAATTAAGLAACDDPLDIPPAIFTNAVDTTVLFALQGTPIVDPSAFDVVGNRPARTDRGEPFDFAFDIDSTAQPILLPAGVLGLTSEPGVLPVDSSFAEVTSAPLSGYITDSALALAVDDVFVVRSRGSSVQCALLGSLPRYGKFRVLAIDPQARTLTLEKLVNLNCGFRGLEPGIPTT